MTDATPGPGTYSLNFHLRSKRHGVIGAGEFGLEFTVPADQGGAHAAIAELMADMAEHLCDMIGIPPLPRDDAPEEAVQPIATGPNGEFPPDLELIYQAFKARMRTEMSSNVTAQHGDISVSAGSAEEFHKAFGTSFGQQHG